MDTMTGSSLTNLGRPGRTEPFASLVIQVAGEDIHVHDLSAPVIRLGRGDDNDICLPVSYASRHQAVLRRTPHGYRLEVPDDATVPLILRGRVVEGEIELAPGDFLRLTGPEPGEMLTILYLLAGDSPHPAAGTLPLLEGETVRIGSDEDNDLGVGHPLLARHHAEISRREGHLFLTDLGSGLTQLNGTVVTGVAVLQPGDRLRLAGLRLVVSPAGLQYASADALIGTRRARLLPEDLLTQMRGTGGVLIEAQHLTRRARGTTILDDVSLRVRPRELVVVVGSSGAGKSTLLAVLAGQRKPTSGRVLIDGSSLYENFDAFRTGIGFVPQRDIVHLDLTVFEALDYAAQLRLPPGTTAEERHARVEEVMADLELTERRDVLVRSLSGGQLKRVSIGAELISSPSLFFLDEPTSGLDPRTETELMHLLRRLADGGRTIILTTHATKNVLLADKILFVVRGGRVAWFGSLLDGLAHFDRYRNERERRDRPMAFDEIYQLVEDPGRGIPQDWAERYQHDPAHARYASPEARSEERREPPRPAPGVSAPRQLVIQTSRNLTLLVRDRFALLLILVVPWGLACLDFLITTRHMFDPVHGDPLRITITTGTLVVDAMLVGALTQMREIVKETDVYRRERLVNLKIPAYVSSKVSLAALLALYQAIAWVTIRYVAVQMPGGFHDALIVYITMVLTVLAGMMLGLLASAVAPGEGSVALIVAVLIIPQVLFNGSLLPLPKLSALARTQTAIMPARWAFEALVSESRVGRQLVTDPNWHLTTAQRDRLSALQERRSPCLGLNIFTECTYPGIRSYATPALHQPPPASPALPAAPGLPPRPHTTSSGYPVPSAATAQDLPAVLTQYQRRLSGYVQRTQGAEIRYLRSLTRYEQRYAAWSAARTKPIATAEGVLDTAYADFGPIYNASIVGRWFTLLGIIVVLIAITLGIRKARELT